jgi:hypothetical protein
MERHHRAEVTRHGVVGEVAGDDLPKPSTLLGNGQVHLSSQRVFDLSQLGLRAITTGFPPYEEFALTCLAADEGEAQKIKGLRLTQTRSGALVRGKAAKRDQSSLVRMQRQRKLFQPRFHGPQEAPCIGFVLDRLEHVSLLGAQTRYLSRGIASMGMLSLYLPHARRKLEPAWSIPSKSSDD